MQCIASVFFMYFACLTPIITFGGLLGAATDNNMVRPITLLEILWHNFALSILILTPSKEFTKQPEKNQHCKYQCLIVL